MRQTTGVLVGVGRFPAAGQAAPGPHRCQGRRCALPSSTFVAALRVTTARTGSRVSHARKPFLVFGGHKTQTFKGTKSGGCAAWTLGGLGGIVILRLGGPYSPGKHSPV